MHLHRLDLNLLVALDILLAERSITKASNRLNRSQSATSGIMARLRDYFEDDLLVQVGRNMVLTPLAASLEKPVRDVILQIQSAIDIRPSFDPATAQRHFRVIASDYPATVVLADIALQLHALAPGVTLEIIAPTEGFAEQLDRGEVDVLIMPDKYLPAQHPSAVLFKDSYSCVVWSDNTLLGDSISLEQFMELGHVSTLFGSQRQAPSFEEWFLKSTGLVRKVEVTTSTFSAMPQFVIGTNRIATMHTRLAKVYARYFPLRLLHPPMEIPPIVESMQWHKFYDRDPAHMWFRSVVRDVAGRAEPQH